jgi:hypothetical protein
VTSQQPENRNYSADTNLIAAWTQSAHAINRSVPGNPVAPIADLAIEGVAALAVAASLAYARRKNADAKQQTTAADSLAEIVVRAGISTQALLVASANGALETVATHIDRNTLAKIAP